MKKYLVIYEKTKTGYSAYVPDLPGVIATGKTKRIVEKNIFEAVQFHLDGLKQEKLPIPKTVAESEILVFAAWSRSGRFLAIISWNKDYQLKQPKNWI